MQFFRVFYHIEQLFFPGMEIPNVFNLTVCQGTPIIIGTITCSMFQIDIFAPVGCCTFGQCQQRTSVHISGNSYPGCFEESRKKVAKFYRSIHLSRKYLLCCRPFHDIRNMCRAFIRICLSPMIMVSHHVTMIGDKNYQGIIIHTFFFQSLNHATYLLVYKRDIGIIITF